MLWHTRMLGILLSIVACAAWAISAAAGDPPKPKDHGYDPVKHVATRPHRPAKPTTKVTKPSHHGKATAGKAHGKKTTGAAHGRTTGKPTHRHHARPTNNGKNTKPVRHTHPRPRPHRPAK